MEKQTSIDCEDFNPEEEDLDTKSQTKTKEDESPKLQTKSLIKSISQALESILVKNKQLRNFRIILKNQSKIVFSANLIPNISIEDYLIRIKMYTQIQKKPTNNNLNIN
jgi:hypothetical protein